jgi:hypothetical protein
VNFHSLEIFSCQFCLPEAGLVEGDIRPPSKDLLPVPCGLSMANEVDRSHILPEVKVKSKSQAEVKPELSIPFFYR